MKRSSARILTTHAGSLVRPPAIIEIMRAIENQRAYDDDTLSRELTPAVAEVVRQQAAVGVDIPSDGEFGKRGWTQYVGERLGGLEFRPFGANQPALAIAGPDRTRFRGFYERYDRIERNVWLPPTPSDPDSLGGIPDVPGGFVCTGPVTYQGKAAIARDIANFQAALRGVTVEEAFLPVVAPCSVEVGRRNEYYPTEEAYLYAIADALREEYQAIIDAGLLLQVDDALLPMQWARMLPNIDTAAFRSFVQVRIEALNHALAGIPPERVRYHICWGSQNVPHISDVPLRDIVDLILQVNAGAYSIEAANPRHEHEWTVWEDTKLPDGKLLIPGVICHSTNLVEHPELVAWRIQNFARLVGRENVIAGTDCGFSQNWNLARVHPEVQWAKLEALVEGARLASKQLW